MNNNYSVNTKKENYEMFKQFTNPYSLRNMANEYLIGGGIQYIKNTLGIEFRLSYAEFDKAFAWIQKYDKKFDNHLSNPQAIISADSDTNVRKRKYIVDKRFVVKLDERTFFYVDAGPASRSSDQETVPEYLYIYVFGKKMIKYAKELANYVNKTQTEYLTNYKVTGNKQDDSRAFFEVLASDLHTRPMDTLFFDDDCKEKIIQHIDKFLSNEEVYKERSLMYKTGILLYGKPGTGKSSLVTAIATQYNYNVISIDMTTFNGLDTNSLSESINADNLKYIVLMEDIDAVVKSRTSKNIDKEDNKVVNKLLQFLDSTSSPTNVIFVATTNYIDKLDEAILRDGRFDLKVEVKELSVNNIDEMCKSFGVSNKDITKIKNHITNDLKLETINQSQLQNIILKTIENK